MTEIIIFTLATGLVFGFGIALVYITWRDLTPLQREVVETRRIAKRWQRVAERWEQQAKLGDELRGIERQILGGYGWPKDDHTGSRKAPDLYAVEGEA